MKNKKLFKVLEMSDLGSKSIQELEEKLSSTIESIGQSLASQEPCSEEVKKGVIAEQIRYMHLVSQVLERKIHDQGNPGHLKTITAVGSLL